MSELIVYKANGLVVSRYDLTEQETRLISYAVAKLNPTANGSEKDRTVVIPYKEYAMSMKIDDTLAWHNLNNAVSELMQRTIEVVNPDPMAKIGKIIFQWVNQAKFDQHAQAVELTFSKEIRPFLFNLKEFIKYKLEHIRSMNNKYSMRFYEVLLKELGESKVQKKDITFDIDDFRDMLMLEANYPTYKQFNQRILKIVLEDVNKNSDLKVSMKTQGRPVSTLIFSVEKKQAQANVIDEVSEKGESVIKKPKPRRTKEQRDNEVRFKSVQSILDQYALKMIALSTKEHSFLKSAKNHYEKQLDYRDFTEKQIAFLDGIIAKYRPRV